MTGEPVTHSCDDSTVKSSRAIQEQLDRLNADVRQLTKECEDTRDSLGLGPYGSDTRGSGAIDKTSEIVELNIETLNKFDLSQADSGKSIRASGSQARRSSTVGSTFGAVSVARGSEDVESLAADCPSIKRVKSGKSVHWTVEQSAK